MLGVGLREASRSAVEDAERFSRREDPALAGRRDTTPPVRATADLDFFFALLALNLKACALSESIHR
jgi:hypothetical protein